jgi:hypothetical protein
MIAASAVAPCTLLHAGEPGDGLTSSVALGAAGRACRAQSE